MKKMMFNDRYGLTDAVLQGRKTVTRRVIDKHRTKLHRINKDCSVELIGYKRIHSYNPPYTVGEIVAVAQSYFDIWSNLVDVGDSYTYHGCKGGFINAINYHYKGVHHSQLSGWTNKMFVKAELMPHQIRIIDVRAERLQAITGEDCFREGILINDIKGLTLYYHKLPPFYARVHYITVREAFASLIDKISGKGTWAHNPYVWRIEFELVK